MKDLLQTIRFFIVLGLLSFSATSFAIDTPDELVKKTAEEVLTAVKNDKEIQAGDQDKIFALAEEKIVPNFNFEKISRMVLGKNWTKATPEQKAAFQTEFRTLLIRTYASALSKYKNQVIDYKPFKMVDVATTASVKTEIVQPGGQPIAVNYTLEKSIFVFSAIGNILLASNSAEAVSITTSPVRLQLLPACVICAIFLQFIRIFTIYWLF